MVKMTRSLNKLCVCVIVFLFVKLSQPSVDSTSFVVSMYVVLLVRVVDRDGECGEHCGCRWGESVRKRANIRLFVSDH